MPGLHVRVDRNHDLRPFIVMPAAEMFATAMEMSIATLMLLFSGFMLFGTGERNAPALAMATLTGVIGLSLVLSLLGSVESLTFLRLFKPTLALLAGPALLVYLSRVEEKNAHPGAAVWLHLLPAIGGVVLMLSPAARYNDLYINVCVGAYWVASVAIYWRRRTVLTAPGLRRFALALTMVFGLVMVLDVILSEQVRELGDHRSKPAYLLALLVLFTGAARLMWTALRRPELLAGPRLLPKYNRTGLDEVASDELGERLEKLMAAHRLFLEEKVSLAAVADRLDVQPRHVSQVINTRFDTNFSAYINDLRVREAARRLEATQERISEVMYAVGFSSKSSFNREFRRRFDMSPREWRETISNKSPPTN